MASGTETDSVHDHMARLKMKMVQQKIANEKDRLLQRPASEESNNNDLDNQVRLQQAMLRRQELLDKIRREQLMNEENKRPRTYSARRRYTPSPPLPPPSRRSLPDMGARNQYMYGPETYRPRQDMSQVKHVIEHQFPQQKPPYHLPPIPNPPQQGQQQYPMQAGQVSQYQAPPPPTIMQAAPPQIIQGPPQHVITTVPNPVIHNLGGTSSDKPQSMFNKADFGEMMMMQNAQMHQMVMQKMMMGSLPGFGVGGSGSGSGSSSPCHHHAPSHCHADACGCSDCAPRQSAVHHHHYSSPAPPPSQPTVHHYTSMPQAEMRGYPLRERQPIQVPNAPPPPVSRMITAPLEVQQSQGRKSNLNTRPSSMFLFGIILKEIVAALHRIYLNPSGNIYPVLNDIIGPNAYDLSSLVRGGNLGTREESVLCQELQYVIENMCYHITEIMPSSGVLGTHRKSAVFELIRSGKRFPDGYFWQVEMERLQFSEHGRSVNIGDAEGFLLLLGIFISRSLVTTILMKPVDYGLSSQPLSEVAERNLRIVASTMLYLVRRIAVSRSRSMMGMPQEIEKYLYTDDEMANVYSKLSRTFNYSEGLLREWGTEYIRRLRASSMQ